MKYRVENKYDLESEVRLYKTEVPNEVFTFAMLLIEKHAMVAGIEDGEDSAGRAKARIQSPEELVARSFKIAELAYNVARERGHIVALPDLNEINAEHDAARKEKHRKQKELEAARKNA